MDNSKPIIIGGSGNSIPFLNSRYNHNGFKNGLDLELEEIIKSNYSIGLNYFYKYGCETTFSCSGDWQFYMDNLEDLKNIPMIIASEDPQLQNNKKSRIHDNTILLKHSGKYFGKESLKQGVYSRQLIGLFSLSLAIALGFKEIYLLGYDCCEINGQTHFYEGVVDLNEHSKVYVNGQLKDKRYKFRGVGKNNKTEYKTSTYNHKDMINKKWFKPFTEEKDVKIYNVSSDSVIKLFPKLSYYEFYMRIKNNHVYQPEARQEIKDFILKNENNN